MIYLLSLVVTLFILSMIYLLSLVVTLFILSMIYLLSLVVTLSALRTPTLPSSTTSLKWTTRSVTEYFIKRDPFVLQYVQPFPRHTLYLQTIHTIVLFGSIYPANKKIRWSKNYRKHLFIIKKILLYYLYCIGYHIIKCPV